MPKDNVRLIYCKKCGMVNAGYNMECWRCKIPLDNSK